MVGSMKLILAIFVCLLAFNSIITLILHNEIVIETSPSTTVAPTPPSTSSEETAGVDPEADKPAPEPEPVEGDEESGSSGPNKTHAEIVRAAVVNKAEMESFEEWKEMKLKNGEAEPTSTPPSSSPSPQSDGDRSLDVTSGVIVVPRRKNYASAECGAKIVASNPEANKPSNILSESKDDYMLNSCANRIWFVIELCEPVRLTEIELANFELFSNVPKQFRVYASERYVASSPSTNWPSKYLMGNFEAANVRSEQKFAIKPETTPPTPAPNDNSSANSTATPQPVVLMYAKYVRFEMLSHYGNEHYCPLSLVRIFGRSITDEEEAVVDASESVIDPVAQSQLPHGSPSHDPNSDFINQWVNERARIFSSSSQFLSNIISTFLGQNFNLSKLFTIFSFNGEGDQNSDHVSTMDSSMPSSTTSSGVVTEHRRNQVLQIDLHKLLCFSSVRNTSDCCQCLPEDKKTRVKIRNKSPKSSPNPLAGEIKSQELALYKSNNWLLKHCGYYFLMITSAQAQLNTSLLFKFLNNMKYSNGVSPLYWVDGARLNTTEGNFTRFSLNNVNYYILNEWLDNQTVANSVTEARKVEKLNTTIVNSIPPNSSTLVEEPVESKTESEKPTPTESSPQLEGNNEPKSEINEENEEPAGQKPADDVNEPITDSIPEQTVDNSDSVEMTPPTTTSTTTSTSTPPTSSAQIPTVVTPVIIGNGKDAVLMRLTNRVKMLELNMTLSSQYLEKLSQHYRKQMDEMQRAFNVTTSALLETMRIADERDIKQNERLVSLDKRVEKMQQSMEAFENLLNDLKFQTDVIIWTIIIILNVIITIEVVRWLRNMFKSSPKKPSMEKPAAKPPILMTAAEVEAIIEERLREFKDSLKAEMDAARKEATAEPHIETIGATLCQQELPQRAAAAAAVVSSTFATVVALAAATAQCNSLASSHAGEEKS